MPSDKRFRVMRFRARCAACGNSWASPLLSDQQSNGEFILFGERGRAFAYLGAFTEPAWDAIALVAASIVGPVPDRDWQPAAARLQHVIAACADPVDGERLTMSHVCPSCQSTDVLYGDGEAMGPIEIPIASFDSFMALSPEDRAVRLRELIAGESS
jgi:hypothetical protein